MKNSQFWVSLLHFNFFAPYSSVFKVNNLFDKLELLNQGWVMSHVVCKVKFLESPFPCGSHAVQMVKFCCLFHRCNLDNFCQVIQALGYYFLAKRL